MKTNIITTKTFQMDFNNKIGDTFYSFQKFDESNNNLIKESSFSHYKCPQPNSCFLFTNYTFDFLSENEETYCFFLLKNYSIL